MEEEMDCIYPAQKNIENHGRSEDAWVLVGVLRIFLLTSVLVFVIAWSVLVAGRSTS